MLFFSFVLSGIPGISQIHKINIDPHSRPKGNLMMSDLVQSIEYIPLETAKDYLVGQITHQAISDNYIAVFCYKSTQIFLFDRNGRFISRIGQEGNGPGEYLKSTIQSIHIEESKNRIIIQTGHPPRLLYYDLKGNYVNAETVDHAIGGIQALFDDYFFIATANTGQNTGYMYELRNRNLEVIKQWGRATPYNITNHSYRNASTVLFPLFNSYRYEDKIHIRETSINDTLYMIEKDFSHTPKYLLNTGKYRITAEMRGDINNFFRNLEASIQMTSVNETSDYLFLSYKYRKATHCGYYDKSQDRIFYFPSEVGIPNDYDAGIPFWPQRQHNNTWSAFYEAHKFEELASKQKKRDAKGPDSATASFKKLISRLQPDDNPVLVIVTLK
jgi:hypothetical protein